MVELLLEKRQRKWAKGEKKEEGRWEKRQRRNVLGKKLWIIIVNINYLKA